jgi:hypothetical protein
VNTRGQIAATGLHCSGVTSPCIAVEIIEDTAARAIRVKSHYFKN